jgi:N-hydroxyarylamine O-acetyltransferase
LQKPDSQLIEKYLKILGLQRQGPDLLFLRKLVEAQLQQVPYENISKLLRLANGGPSLPSFEEFVLNLEKFNFGGTCYVQNGYFVELLRGLEFQADLISTDADNRQQAHAATRVRIDDENYAIDLGMFSTFSGPFHISAGNVVESKHGRMSYRFEAFNNENYQMQTFRNGVLERTHRSDPQPRNLAFFSPAIQASFEKDAIFMKTIATHRVVPDHGPVMLWGYALGKSDVCGRRQRERPPL